MIVLDTVNENGEADGSLDAAQNAWLLTTLAEQPARLTVVLGHHTGDTMANPLVATGGDLSPRSCARATPRRGVRRVPVGRVSARRSERAGATVTIRLIHAGLGGWGGDWEATAIEPVAEVDRVAVVDPHEPTLRRFQELRDLPDSACSTSFERMLADADADAVLLTTPVRTHVPMALQALEAGKHVLVEKPFASTVEEAAVAVRRAEELGLVLQVSQNYRFYPAPRAAQELVAAGALGELSSISIDFRRWDHDAPAGTYGHYAFPHPLIHDMAIHHLDLLRKITGQEAVRVYAQASDPSWSRYAEEASAVMTIELADGLVVSYRGSWVSRAPETDWGGAWTVDGAEGAIAFTTRAGGAAGPDGDAMTLHRPGADPVDVPLPAMGLWGRSAGLQEFARAVEGGPASEANARGNLGSVALMEAATRSAASGRVEDVLLPADLIPATGHRTEESP